MNDNDEKRALFESCTLKGKRVCNPIIDWTNKDVWDFIRSEHPVSYTHLKCTGKKVIIDFCNTKVYEDKVSYEIKEEIF